MSNSLDLDVQHLIRLTFFPTCVILYLSSRERQRKEEKSNEEASGNPDGSGFGYPLRGNG